MSFSQAFRALNTWSRRRACKIWSAKCVVQQGVGKGASELVTSHRLLRSVRCVVNRRLFSSDSKKSNLDEERYKLRNDPEIKAWMNQIAQDFETDRAPFQIVEDQPQTTHAETKLFDRNASSSENAAPVQVTADIQVEDFGYIEDDEEEVLDTSPERTLPVSLKRGQHGVFDVEEIVAVLEDENGMDIQVIDIPPEARFVDHMVVVSGKSLRHMRAMAASIEWLYKRKKGKNDRRLSLEGRDCKDWFALDLGNIAVHIFTPEARQHYDLETLWTLGPEHDDPRHYVQDDDLDLSAADLFWLETNSKVEASSMQTFKETNEVGTASSVEDTAENGSIHSSRKKKHDLSEKSEC